MATYLQYSSYLNAQGASLSQSLLLSKAILASTWLRSMGRQELQVIFAELYARYTADLTVSLMSGDQFDDV